MKLNVLVLLGILKVENDSEWGAPYFAQPQTKSIRVHVLSDFRNLIKELMQKPYPLPKIKEMLFKLECFSMYDYYTMGKISIQASTNRIC